MKFERPKFAQLDPSRNASEARFVGVSQRLQNTWKSAKLTIYTHPRTPTSLTYVSFISTFEPPEFAQLDPSRNASEARFIGVVQTLQNKWKSTTITIPKPPTTPTFVKIDKG